MVYRRKTTSRRTTTRKTYKRASAARRAPAKRKRSYTRRDNTVRIILEQPTAHSGVSNPQMPGGVAERRPRIFKG